MITNYIYKFHTAPCSWRRSFAGNIIASIRRKERNPTGLVGLKNLGSSINHLNLFTHIYNYLSYFFSKCKSNSILP